MRDLEYAVKRVCGAMPETHFKTFFQSTLARRGKGDADG